MKLLMHFFEVWISDMRINLGGGNVAVAQHALHTANVGAIHQ